MFWASLRKTDPLPVLPLVYKDSQSCLLYSDQVRCASGSRGRSCANGMSGTSIREIFCFENIDIFLDNAHFVVSQPLNIRGNNVWKQYWPFMGSAPMWGANGTPSYEEFATKIGSHCYRSRYVWANHTEVGITIQLNKGYLMLYNIGRFCVRCTCSARANGVHPGF